MLENEGEIWGIRLIFIYFDSQSADTVTKRETMKYDLLFDTNDGKAKSVFLEALQCESFFTVTIPTFY